LKIMYVLTEKALQLIDKSIKNIVNMLRIQL